MRRWWSRRQPSRRESRGGIPAQRSASSDERFTRSDDGETLNLTATIEDPWGLREPVVAKKIWRWAPNQKITPYDACEPATEFKKGTGEP